MASAFERQLNTLARKPRILVCAPSNAAADELLQRVMNDGFADGNGHVYRPSVVRIGRSVVIPCTCPKTTPKRGLPVVEVQEKSHCFCCRQPAAAGHERRVCQRQWPRLPSLCCAHQ